MFIKDGAMKDFYMNKIEKLLNNYAPGKPEMKPDVVKQIIELEESRKKQLLELQLQWQMQMQSQSQNKGNNQIVIQQGNNPPQSLTTEQIVHLLQQQKNQIDYLLKQIKGKDMEIELLTEQLKKI